LITEWYRNVWNIDTIIDNYLTNGVFICQEVISKTSPVKLEQPLYQYQSSHLYNKLQSELTTILTQPLISTCNYPYNIKEPNLSLPVVPEREKFYWFIKSRRLRYSIKKIKNKGVLFLAEQNNPFKSILCITGKNRDDLANKMLINIISHFNLHNAPIAGEIEKTYNIRPLSKECLYSYDRSDIKINYDNNINYQKLIGKLQANNIMIDTRYVLVNINDSYRPIGVLYENKGEGFNSIICSYEKGETDIRNDLLNKLLVYYSNL